MSFPKHETFIRGTSVRADKFYYELTSLFNQYDNNDHPNIRKFLDQFADIVVFAEYQKEWLDTFIREFYYQVNVKMGQHNSVMPLKSTWRRCPNCNNRVLTILNPNDSIEGSRTADFRIFCYTDQWTYLIKNNVHIERQSIYSFLKTELKHFNIEAVA